MIKKKIKSTTIYNIIIIFFFSVIIAQLFSHQIANGERYEEISRRNYIRIRRVDANRGMILDEKLRPLASNRPSINLYFIPSLISDRAKFIDFVSQQVDITREQLEKLIYDNRFKAFEEILIVEDLHEETLAIIAENMNYYPELLLKTEILRHYNIPNHFTGYIGKIDENDFKRFKGEDYSLNSKIGKVGIERYYEGLLAGKPGHEIIQVDAMGRSLNLFKNDVIRNPINGLNVVLTINLELQEFIHSIFPRDHAGAVIVMNTKTGGILAYNSFPEYDQNWFAEGITTAQWNYLREHELKPLLDRVATGRYAPGSTYKPISSAFGLEKGYMTDQTTMARCTGGMQIGNRFFRCWNEWGHGRVNVYDAMAVSCDVYYYDLSARFNLDEFANFSYANFLHDKTGIDLPTENSGFFPKTDWYVRRIGRFLSTTGIKANLVIGQGEVLVTPLAMCTYYTAIANNGVWQTPHLFKEAFNENGTIHYDFLKKNTQQLPYSERTMQIIQKSLYDTVHKSNGTARTVAVPGTEVYAKTGSTENSQGELTHASIAGYVKWNNEPEIAFYIIVENAGHGGAIASPIARRIIQFYHENIRKGASA